MVRLRPSSAAQQQRPFVPGDLPQRTVVSAPSPEWEISSAHLVGICGSGMKALAELLTGMGCRVTGSDLSPPSPVVRAMKRRGLRIHAGHHDRFLPRDVDVLVHSPAVGLENPERRLAAHLGIPQMSYSRMLGRLMQGRTGISIAGTHGKSTTTAMTAAILADAGRSPSAVVGAELCGRGVSGWAGNGDLFVVESCEYQRSFLDLAPRLAVILGIEPDHFDYYREFRDMQAAFAEFAARVPEDGTLFVRGDCPASMAVAEAARSKVVTFSRERGSDWWAADVRPTADGQRFRVFYRGDFFAEIALPLRGEHNVLNALAAIAVAHHCGVPAGEVRDSLQEFGGIRRRYERIGWWRGISIIDDYAHHPTAVRATLEAARGEFGRRRTWCVYQPHQVSRTRILMDEFSRSFGPADEVLIAPIFAARETGAAEHAEAAAAELASRIAREGQRARFGASLDRIVATLEDEAFPGDVLITMGAGDIDRVHHEFTGRLRRNRAAG